MNRAFLFGLAVLMAPAGDDGAGAAGGPPPPVPAAGGPPAPDPPVTPPAAPAKPPAPSGAAAALKSIEAARAEAKAKREAAQKPAAAPGAAPAVDPELQSAAEKWRAYEKAESARIATEAEGLDPEDKALIDGEKDITRKAALLARFKREASAAAPAKPAKPVAPAKPAGGPPSAGSVDFEAAWAGGQQAWDAAKARDPEGASKWLAGRNAPSASSNPFSRMFNRKPSKG